MKFALIVSFIILFIVSGCFLSSPAYNTWIDYNGIDFSRVSYSSNIDISLTNINPSTGERINGAYYFRVYSEPGILNIKDMGKETFNYIDRISSGFPWDTVAYALNDHLYVVKCRDGFAKFKVLMITGSNVYDTKAVIYFEFTNDSTF